jgi:8-oxo-dGTP diphosphatase
MVKTPQILEALQSQVEKFMRSDVDDKLIRELMVGTKKDRVGKIVVAAVIIIGEKLLLLRRAASDSMGGLVEFPSGKVNKKESLLTAIARETLEETGLSLKAVRYYLASFDYSSKGVKTRKFVFLAETEPGEVKLNLSEHDAHYLVSFSSGGLDDLNASDSVKSVLEVFQKAQIL